MMDLAEEEVWARDCLREALPGCAVDQYDDNSKASMYDLTITYPGGAIGAVEVTAAADTQQLELWKLVEGRANAGSNGTLSAAGSYGYCRPRGRRTCSGNCPSSCAA